MSPRLLNLPVFSTSSTIQISRRHGQRFGDFGVVLLRELLLEFRLGLIGRGCAVVLRDEACGQRLLGLHRMTGLQRRQSPRASWPTASAYHRHIRSSLMLMVLPNMSFGLS